MTDSVDRNHKLTPAEKRAKLAALRERKPTEFVEVAQLPGWVKFALVDRELYNTPLKELSEKFNRNANTITRYAATKAAKKFCARLRETMMDPEKIAQWLVESEQASQAVRYIALADVAEQTGDLSLAEKIRRNLLLSGGGLKPPAKDGQDARPVIVFNVQGNRGLPILEAIEVESESRRLPKPTQGD